MRYRDAVLRLKAENYWPMDERSPGTGTSRDVTGGKHATWQTAPTTQMRSLVGGELGIQHLTGSSTGAYCEQLTGLGFNFNRDLTFVFWADIETPQQTYDAALGQSDASITDYVLLIRRDDHSGWVWQINPGGAGASFLPSTSAANQVPGDGVWMIAAGRVGNTWWTEANADPSKYAEGTLSGTINSTDNLHLGTFRTSTQRFFGQLGHVATFGRSLTRKERLFLYRVGRYQILRDGSPKSLRVR